MKPRCEWCGSAVERRKRNDKKPRFCSQNCFKESERAKRKVFKCEHCGIAFSKRIHGISPRFCSGECWYAWQRKRSHNTNPIYTCKYCKQPFARRYKAAKPPQFCSPKCGNAARRKITNCICRGCGKEFTKSRPDQAGAYCSRRCFIENKRTREREYRCGQCGKEFKRITWPGNDRPEFCSRKCAAIAQRGKRRSKTPPLHRTCKLCNGSMAGKPAISKFCSRKCSIKGEYLAGKMDYRVRGFVTTIKRKNKLCCERCGDDNLHHLTVHHRDEDRRNNAEDNLQTLCANCHFEIHWADTVSRATNIKRALQIAAYTPS